MSDNVKRYDLSIDPDDHAVDLLRDIRAASDHARQRLAAQKAEASRHQEQGRSRKLTGILIGIGAVLLVMLSYWIVFARDEVEQVTVTSRQVTTSQIQATVPTSVTPNPSYRTNPPTPSPTAPVGRDSQLVQHPPDGYEQPSDSPGM
jgi:cell division protein FtsN